MGLNDSPKSRDSKSWVEAAEIFVFAIGSEIAKSWVDVAEIFIFAVPATTGILSVAKTLPVIAHICRQPIIPHVKPTRLRITQ